MWPTRKAGGNDHYSLRVGQLFPLKKSCFCPLASGYCSVTPVGGGGGGLASPSDPPTHISKILLGGKTKFIKRAGRRRFLVHNLFFGL